MSEFQSLAQAMPRAIAALLRSTPMSPGKLQFAWKTTVGPAMARGTFVRLDGRKLLVEARTAAWAKEVSRSSRMILKRLQALLGADAITELIIRV